MMNTRPLIRLPLYWVVFLLSFFMIAHNDLFAQNGETAAKITVSIKETGWQNIKDKGKNKFVWRFYKGDSNHMDSALTNSKMEYCFRAKSKKNNKSKEIDDAKDELKSFIASTAGFNITMEAFNNKGGDKCDADKKDAYYSVKQEYISLKGLAPNVWSEEFKIEDNFPRFYAIITYKYDLVNGLGEIGYSSREYENDVTRNIELSLPLNLYNKENLPFTWKYTTGTDNNWTTLLNTGKNKSLVEFNPLRDIFNNKLTTQEKIRFKAEVVNIDNKTDYSDELELLFAPAPPDYDDKDNQKFPACNGLANGGITIQNIKTSASAIKYVLIRKTDPTVNCDLGKASAENCPGFIRSNTVPGKAPLEIKNLAVGVYDLYLFNADLESGRINTKVPFTISELSPLKKTEEDYIVQPSCVKESGGEITMNVEGGGNLWQIAIIPNKGEFKWEGNKIAFKNLEPGRYTVYLTDQCGGQISTNITLKSPKKISIAGAKAIPLKNETAVQLNIKNGSGDYTIKITHPGLNITNEPIMGEINIPVNEVGIYKFEVTDNEKSGCPPAMISIKVERSKNPKSGKYTIKVVEEQAAGL